MTDKFVTSDHSARTWTPWFSSWITYLQAMVPPLAPAEENQYFPN